jgi:two-component system sensor histidine kinase SenX3
MPVVPGRRGAIAFFVIFGVSLVALATALNVGWIVLTSRQIVPLVFGIFVFAAIITGLILNTTFLVREIRRNEQHDAFVNAVTHELKTPVTSIQLHLETLMAREATLSEARRREFYGVMLEDAHRLLQTIEQVLRTGQAGSTPLHLEHVDLAALADECVAFTRTRRHLGDEAVRVDPAAARIEIVADRNELRGALINLLDNAVKFSGDRVDVQVGIASRGERAVIRVRDHGPGLPQDEAKRIFKRFYRVPGPLTQRVKGTGLGLFIVQSAAKRHGGRAWAESDGPGTGSTFCLELPAAPPTASA